MSFKLGERSIDGQVNDHSSLFFLSDMTEQRTDIFGCQIFDPHPLDSSHLPSKDGKIFDARSGQTPLQIATCSNRTGIGTLFLGLVIQSKMVSILTLSSPVFNQNELVCDDLVNRIAFVANKNLVNRATNSNSTKLNQQLQLYSSIFSSHNGGKKSSLQNKLNTHTTTIGHRCKPRESRLLEATVTCGAECTIGVRAPIDAQPWSIAPLSATTIDLALPSMESGNGGIGSLSLRASGSRAGTTLGPPPREFPLGVAVLTITNQPESGENTSWSLLASGLGWGVPLVPQSSGSYPRGTTPPSLITPLITNSASDGRGGTGPGSAAPVIRPKGTTSSFAITN